MKRLSALFFLILLTLSSLCAQTAQLRGRVSTTTGEPLVGATVFMPELRRGAFTDESGIFSINRLPKGEYAVEVFYVGYDTLKKNTNFSAGQIRTEAFILQETQIFFDEVEITAQQEGRIETKEVEVGKVQVSSREINLLPSVGAPDLMQYLQVLPGIVFTGDQGGQLYIRGGTPIQNMTLMDNMIMYSPFHSIGLFSVFDPDMIRSVDVYSAGFPARYGGRVSSIIDIKTRTGNLERVSGKLNVNPFSSALLVEGPIARSRRPGAGSSFLVSARRNYIDQTSPALYNYVNDTVGLPYNFTDVYGKLSLTDGVNFANVFGFRHADNVNYGFESANIGWTAAGGGADFALLPQGAGAIIRGNIAYSNYQVGLNAENESFPRNSSVSGFNGGLNVSYIVNSVDNVNAGVNFLGFATDYSFTNSLGFVTSDRKNNSEFVVYGEYKKVFRSKKEEMSRSSFPRDIAVLEPGIRFHYFNDQAHFSVEPRLRLKINLPRVSISGATGLYTQNLMSAASDRDVVNFFQGILSAPDQLAGRTRDNNLQYAFHALAGVEIETARFLTTQIEAWYKDFTQLTNVNRQRLFPEDTAFLAETGQAYGFDFVVKYVRPAVYLYATYGWAKVTRNDRTQIYPPVFDRRHTVNFVGSYRFGRFDYVQTPAGLRVPKFKDYRWELGVRWTLGSGFPFTQTQGYYEQLNFFNDGAQSDIATQNGDLGLILSQDLNGGRLPYYHRLDLTLKRRWLIKNSWLLELDASFINAYNRQNIFYFDRVTFDRIDQLPVLPTLGVTARY